MLSVDNKNKELECLHKFFNETSVYLDTLEYIEYDEKDEKFINQYKNYVLQEAVRIDPSLPITAIRIPYNTLQDLIMHSYNIEFLNKDTNKLIQLAKKDAAVFAIIGDIEKKHIQILRNSESICRSQSHTAISIDTGIRYDTSIVNDNPTLNKYLTPKTGICVLVVLNMNLSNTELTVKEEKTSFIKKLFNLFSFSSKETTIDNTRASVTLYFCQWDINEEGINIYDYTDEEFLDYLEAKDLPKTDNGYTPVCDKDPYDVKAVIDEICKTGFGEVKFTITGLKTEISNRRKEKYS